MCCGEAFWKRVVVFCFAFGLGVGVSGLFVSKESVKENNNPAPISAPAENPAEKNCVPVDGNLKYERLTVVEQTTLETKKQENKKKSVKENLEKQNNSAESKPQFYNPSKDSAEYKVLLHREKCFETQEQK
jgi:hypothetical protein